MPKGISSHTEFMRRFFPKEYEKRKAEDRCLHCGAKKPEPRFPIASRRERHDG